jgi:hypothetical protein
LFEDPQRLRAIQTTVDRIVERPSALAWGLGWGNSGDGLVVHNLFIQVAAEAGVPLCMLLAALLALPFAWGVRTRFKGVPEVRLGLLVALTVWLGLLLNPFPMERISWLGFAVAIGLVHRARLGCRLPAPGAAAVNVRSSLAYGRQL